ncbi:hypothetical protein [Vibrio cholerae]|uniref:hypothetical protein n=1 Tax=Vibrio cholerae TaxID=666 RepID=UPI0011DC550C|nr:hypothetical protein [Vibrio cholerae]TXY52067.1 hypothetical protein FXE74_18980 [Vibrio cholerae]GIB31807.1 hypothetical protein VCSRO91_2832 [Vibrio cholerae]
MNNGTLSFKNISMLPSGAFQVKLKKERREFQPYAKSLRAAISLRNECYKLANYRPCNLHIKMFDLSVIAPHPRGGFQVHSRRLHDRKYMPRQFASKIDAKNFATRWIKAHNGIASIYNGKRETAFLAQIEQELIEQKPYIEVTFSSELWLESAKELFGEAIPEFFE